MELRCSGNKLHGILATKSTGQLEVRCDSVFCGKAAGIVVLHRFDLSTGKYHTEQYLEPNLERNKSDAS